MALQSGPPQPPAAAGWRPRPLLVTRSAMGFAHGHAIAERAASLGVEVAVLASDRLALDLLDDPRRAYAAAKATLAVVVAPPSKRRLDPIAPSADWRIVLAEGCPAHCGYCYLAGSLKGPPITRAYANLDEILDGLPAYLGQIEASCYTDPLALEPITGSPSIGCSILRRDVSPISVRDEERVGREAFR